MHDWSGVVFTCDITKVGGCAIVSAIQICLGVSLKFQVFGRFL